MDDLPLEVRHVDGVEVDQPDGADTGRRQVEGDRGAEPAGADDEDFGRLEPPLPVEADFGHDDVAGIAGELGLRQFDFGDAAAEQVGQGHGYRSPVSSPFAPRADCESHSGAMGHGAPPSHRAADADRSRSERATYTAARATEQLCPPNPKLFDSTRFTRTSRAVFGM